VVQYTPPPAIVTPFFHSAEVPMQNISTLPLTSSNLALIVAW
jgi:hypothetical protein